jgi:hypothetical protein
MRQRSREYCGRIDKAAVAAGTMRAVLVVSAIGIGAEGTISHSAAQGTASDVAYVEAVSGRVVASFQGRPALLDVLDIIGDQTRLVLPPNSELRICHHLTRKLVTLRGPLRGSVSVSGVTTENGNAFVTPGVTCAAPIVSTVPGGIVSRATAVTTMKVPLRPSIKVVNDGAGTIRQMALWDGMHQKILATFDRNVARPILDDGESYLLVVERSDGSELKMMLEASAVAQTGPLIVVVQ